VFQSIGGLQQAMRPHLRPLAPYIPLLTIWGSQWIAAAILDMLLYWPYADTLRTGSAAVAVILSVIQIYYTAGRRDKANRQEADTALRLWMSLPFVVAVGAALLLYYIHAADRNFIEMLRALLLAFCYVQLGVFIGRQLVYLGLWLFALCGVTGMWYLGFAPILLGLFGGLSLIACGLMIKRWIGVRPSRTKNR
jgi:hypothetical protein